MPVFTYALPIRPGQTERVLKFGAEIQERGLREEYDALNEQATIRQHIVAVQPGPPIELAIHTLVCDDMNKLGRMFTNAPYDQWWLDFLRDVHGLDVRMNPSFPNPRTVFDSARPPAPAGPPGAPAGAPGGPPAGGPPRPPGPPAGAPGGPPPQAAGGPPPQAAGGPPPQAAGGPPQAAGGPPAAPPQPAAAPAGAPAAPPAPPRPPQG